MGLEKAWAVELFRKPLSSLYQATKRKGSACVQPPSPRGRALGPTQHGTRRWRLVWVSPSQADIEKVGGVNWRECLPAQSQLWLLMGIPGEVSGLPGSHPRPRGPSGPGIPLSESSPGDWMRARVGTKLLAQFLSHFPYRSLPCAPSFFLGSGPRL